MSRITEALAKAARERKQRQHEEGGTPAQQATVKRSTTATAEPAAIAAGTVDPHVVAFHDDRSPIMEQYRMLRTNLQSANVPSNTKIILFTSAINGEGKSLTALNLALTIAQNTSKRVLLVDADLRRPKIQEYLGLDRRSGLTDLLRNGASAFEHSVKIETTNLTVITAGSVIPDNPVELLDSPRMKELLRDCKTRYDYVLVDAPPVLPVADSTVLGALADGVVMIVQAGRSQRRDVQRAEHRLIQAKAKLIGTVLTRAESRQAGSYYYEYQNAETESEGGHNPAPRSTLN